MDLKERIKQLMTEVICHLCTKEVPHKYQIQIEGTICISSDTEPPFAIQIAQLLSKAETEPARARYERESSYGDGSGTSPGEAPPPGKARHHSSPGDGGIHFTDQARYHRRADSGIGDQPGEGQNESLDLPHPINYDRMDSTDTTDTLGKDQDLVVESVSPHGEILQSTKRGSLERAPLPQKKRRRYSITQPEPPPSGIEGNDDRHHPGGEEREIEIMSSLPQKKRESARKFPSDEGIEVDKSVSSEIDEGDDRQFTVKDMVRNLISSRDKGPTSQILSDISKSLSAGTVKLVIPSVGSPPDTPLTTPGAYDDHVFDLDTPMEPIATPLTPTTPLTPAPSMDVPDTRELTLLQPLALAPVPSDKTLRPSALTLPPRGRKSSTSLDVLSPLPYRSTPLPAPESPDIKAEPLDPNYDNKSLLTNLGHMSKEAINGLIIVDQETQKAISPQDYVYKDETTGETLIKACDYCGKHFKYLSKLMEHIRSHTKTKPYKCSICGRTYTYKGDLTVHIRQHSLAKPYVCECGRAFASKKYLSVHQSQARIKGRHAVSKDDRMGPMFECTQCGKRFKFFSSFDLHLQTHSLQSTSQSLGQNGRDVYECQACRCSFQDHVMFVEHVLEHEHGNIVNKEKEKQRCQSLSSISPREERKRRLSERASPIKHDASFFRPSTSGDFSAPLPSPLPSPQSMAPLPSPQLGPLSSPQQLTGPLPSPQLSGPLPSPQLGPMPSPVGVVLGTSAYTNSQYSTSTQSGVMYPNIQLSAAPIRMSVPIRMTVPTSMRLLTSPAGGVGMISHSGGAVIENRSQGGGKMYVDISRAPFSPRLVPASPGPGLIGGPSMVGGAFTLPEGVRLAAVNEQGPPGTA